MLLKKNCSICNAEITGWGQAHLDRMFDLHMEQQHGNIHVVSAPVVVVEKPNKTTKKKAKKKTKNKTSKKKVKKTTKTAKTKRTKKKKAKK